MQHSEALHHNRHTRSYRINPCQLVMSWVGGGRGLWITEQSTGKPSAAAVSHAILNCLRLLEPEKVCSVVVRLRYCDAGQLQHQRHVVLGIGKLQMVPFAARLTGAAVTVRPALLHPTARYTTCSLLLPPCLHTLRYPPPHPETPLLYTHSPPDMGSPSGL